MSAMIDFEIELNNFQITNEGGKTILKIKADNVDVESTLDNFTVHEAVEHFTADCMFDCFAIEPKDIIEYFGKDEILSWFE